MLKKILTAVLCAFMLVCTVVSAAAELKAGDTAYVVYGGTVNVTKTPAYSGGCRRGQQRSQSDGSGALCSRRGQQKVS